MINTPLIRRLLRRKKRLTHRLVKSDFRWTEFHMRLGLESRVRKHRLLRMRLYRIDLMLERAGILQGHTWMPGVQQNPGLNANYRRGRVIVMMIILHYTVGTSSLGIIMNKGLAQFLVDRDGTIHECAPADAVCAGACEWNIYAVHIEVEAEDRGQWTAAQIASVAHILGWGMPTYGVPNAMHFGPDYDGSARIPVGAAVHGIYNHGALHERACDEHSDGATTGEWAQVNVLLGAGPAPLPTLTEETEMGNCIIDPDGVVHVFSILSSTEVQERWGHPGKPSFYTHKFKDYPLKPAGKVSCARSPKDPHVYSVALERDDGSERCMHRIKALDGSLAWDYE